MKGRDPIESLERHYATRESVPDADLEVGAVFARRDAYAHQRIAGALAFSAGLAAAAIFLMWAAKPLPVSQSGAAAIARNQMIHSGLVQRAAQGGGVQ